jgi:hypothetical protein
MASMDLDDYFNESKKRIVHDIYDVYKNEIWYPEFRKRSANFFSFMEKDVEHQIEVAGKILIHSFYRGTEMWRIACRIILMAILGFALAFRNNYIMIFGFVAYFIVRILDPMDSIRMVMLIFMTTLSVLKTKDNLKDSNIIVQLSTQVLFGAGMFVSVTLGYSIIANIMISIMLLTIALPLVLENRLKRRVELIIYQIAIVSMTYAEAIPLSKLKSFKTAMLFKYVNNALMFDPLSNTLVTKAASDVIGENFVFYQLIGLACYFLKFPVLAWMKVPEKGVSTRNKPSVVCYAMGATLAQAFDVRCIQQILKWKFTVWTMFDLLQLVNVLVNFLSKPGLFSFSIFIGLFGLCLITLANATGNVIRESREAHVGRNYSFRLNEVRKPVTIVSKNNDGTMSRGSGCLTTEGVITVAHTLGDTYEVYQNNRKIIEGKSQKFDESKPDHVVLIEHEVHTGPARIKPYEKGNLLMVNNVGKETFIPEEDVEITESRIYFKIDTEPGDSGSPIFSQQGDIVALHGGYDSNKDKNFAYLPMGDYYEKVKHRVATSVANIINSVGRRKLKYAQQQGLVKERFKKGFRHLFRDYKNLERSYAQVSVNESYLATCPDQPKGRPFKFRYRRVKPEVRQRRINQGQNNQQGQPQRNGRNGNSLTRVYLPVNRNANNGNNNNGQE